ncbi:hypothetical protein FOA52_005917 [Chlamydomonas sp. UWO 241]|nr:hypothetical protein FOA52_005917 [Chlamydomonas sp. UWO 241]
MKVLSTRTQKALSWLPGGVFCLQVFAATLSIEACHEVLDLLGLLAALGLVMVIAVPTAFDYDELVAADARFGFVGSAEPQAPTAYSIWWSVKYSPSAAMTLLLLTSTFCFVVVLLTLMSQHINRTLPEHRVASWRRCYLCVAITTVLMLGLMAVAMILSLLGFCVVLLIKVPDFGLMMLDALGTAETADVNKSSTIYFTIMALFVAGPIAAIGMFLIGSLSSVLVFRRMLDHTDHSCEMAEEDAVSVVDDLPPQGFTAEDAAPDPKRSLKWRGSSVSPLPPGHDEPSPTGKKGGRSVSPRIVATRPADAQGKPRTKPFLPDTSPK